MRPLELLGRHVAQRAHHLVLGGQRRIADGADEFGQAEVGDFHSAALVEQNVFRLDVAMHDPFVMGELQGVANLRHDGQRILRRHFAGSNRLPQIHAVNEFHDDIKQPVALAEVVDADDIRMIQPGQRAGLAREPFGEGRIAAHFGRQDFHGHQSIEARLPRFVNRAHASLAEQFQHFELRKTGGELLDRRRNESGRRRRRRGRLKRGRLRLALEAGQE